MATLKTKEKPNEGRDRYATMIYSPEKPREEVRNKLNNDVARFLSQGGKIKQCKNGETGVNDDSFTNPNRQQRKAAEFKRRALARG